MNEARVKNFLEEPNQLESIENHMRKSVLEGKTKTAAQNAH